MQTFEEKQMIRRAVLQISQAIVQARINFGLTGATSDSTSDEVIAESAFMGCSEIRKTPRVEDILESIRLFGMGIIRFKDQLSVVSVQNIVRSFEFYVKEYKPKQNDPALAVITPASHQLGDGTEYKNKIARREMFLNYLNGTLGKTKMGIDFSFWYLKVYDQLVEMGLIDSQNFIPLYRILLITLLNDEEGGLRMPPDFKMEIDKKMAVRAVREWIEGHMEGDKVVLYPFERFQNNLFHRYLVGAVKLGQIRESLNIGKDKLMEKYDSHYGTYPPTEQP